MTRAAITKTLNKIAKTMSMSNTDDFYTASLAFHRLFALPVRVRRSFDIAAYLETNDLKSVNKFQLDFLEGLQEEEFKNWLMAQ